MIILLIFQIINIVNLFVIWAFTTILLFQDVKILIVNSDITSYLSFVAISMLLLSVLTSYLAWIYKPRTNIQSGFVLLAIVGLGFMMYTLYNLVKWFTITEEGVITYKFLTLVKTASYDVKLNSYNSHLEALITHISNSDFKSYLIDTYNIYAKKPQGIQKLPLSEMGTLAQAEINKALIIYNQMLEATTSINDDAFFKKALIVTGVVVAVIFTIYYFSDSTTISYLAKAVGIVKDSLKESTKSAELQQKISITGADLANTVKEQSGLIADLINNAQRQDININMLKDCLNSALTSISGHDHQILMLRQILYKGLFDLMPSTLGQTKRTVIELYPVNQALFITSSIP